MPMLGLTQTPIHWAPGTLSSGPKRPTGDEIKNAWIHTSSVKLVEVAQATLLAAEGSGYIVHSVQTRFGARSISYAVGNGGPFTGT